jgi:hypothetical protein
MKIDIEGIIIITICIVASIILIIFMNRDKLNCTCPCNYKKNKKSTILYSYQQELKKNTFEDNVALIKQIEEGDKKNKNLKEKDKDKELELL